LTVVGAGTLIPTVEANSVSFTVVGGPLPTWFVHDAPRLPTDTIVLVVSFAGETSMGWQAPIGFHAALANGFAAVPGPSGRSALAVRSAMVRWNAGAVVVTDQGGQPAPSVGFLSAVFKRTPAREDGVWAWRGRPEPTPMTIVPTALAGDASSMKDAGLDVPSCVLNSGAREQPPT
jgi:hypothetical protein